MVINMNYPKGIVKPQHNSIIYSNRGMNLESDLNTTCEYYLINDIAIIWTVLIIAQSLIYETTGNLILDFDTLLVRGVSSRARCK